MARDDILLDGVKFEVAKDRNGARLREVTPRASQRGDPGDLQVAEWRVDGPDFTSFEVIPPGGAAGYLGREYGVNTDGRWFGLDQLGPQINTIDCSTHDTVSDAVENARAQAHMQAWDTTYAYVGRGTRPAKIDQKDMSLKDTDVSFGVPVTDMVATLAARRQDDFGVVGHLVDGTNLNLPRAVEISPDGRHAYVTAQDADRLTVVDISDPENPTVVGSVQDATNLDAPQGLAVAPTGDHVYVAAANRLTVVDVTDPTAPAVVGNVQDGTDLLLLRDVVVTSADDFVFVSTGTTDRLTAVDVSTKSTPSVAGSLLDATNLDDGRGLAISSDDAYVYVACFGDRLTVIDVGTPATPSLKGSVTHVTDLGDAIGVAISADDETAYVTCYTPKRFTVVDVSTPATPSITGSVTDGIFLDGATGVVITGNTSFVYVTASGGNAVTLMDVSTPASPTVSATIRDTTNLNFASGLSITPDGNFLAVTGFNSNSVTVLELAQQELSAALGDSTAYQVLRRRSVGKGVAADTWVANADSQAARAFGIAPKRIVSMAENVIRGNILTGAVTQADGNWNTVATIAGRPRDLRLQSFGLDGSRWVIGTSDGPYMLDDATGEFFPVLLELATDNEHCRFLGTWFPLGLLIPLRSGLRHQRSGFGQSIGPEIIPWNTSPVTGQPTGWAASERWGFCTFLNRSTGDTYLCAVRPRESGDPHPFPVSWFTLAKLSSLESRYLSYVGTVNGLRTNETLMGGYGSNVFWLTAGRTAREIDDANYRNATSGTTHLTELRRQPGLLKDVEAVELESAQCGANDKITISCAFDDAAAVTLTGSLTYTGGATLNGVVDTNGFQRVLAIDDSRVPLSAWSGRRMKPQLAYAANAATASPQVVGGTLRIFYRIRALTVKVHRFTLLLRDGAGRTAEELEAALLANERDDGPVTLEDLDADDSYVRVKVGRVYERADLGGGKDSARRTERVADVTLTTWQVAA